VPWHCHSNIQDTFYVLEGRLRLFLREPKEEVRLGRGDTYSVRPGRPHLVTNGGDGSATFLVLEVRLAVGQARNARGRVIQPLSKGGRGQHQRRCDHDPVCLHGHLLNRLSALSRPPSDRHVLFILLALKVEAQDGQFIFEVQVYLDELIPTRLSTKEFDVVI
jgi:hypothetical protein